MHALALVLTIELSVQDSMVVGLIIVERCRMEPDSESGNKYSFKLGESMDPFPVHTFDPHRKRVHWFKLVCTRTVVSW